MEGNAVEEISSDIPLEQNPEISSIVSSEQVGQMQEESVESVPPEDEKLAQYLPLDPVYQALLRTEEQQKIRFSLAIKYTLLVFAFFLVFAWIVSNRVIMFGFSEFVWLARVRDVLFGIMVGLFSVTVWFGAAVWTTKKTFLWFLRFVAVILFIGVTGALYFSL